MLVVPMAGRGGASGRINMARLFVLAGGAIVVGGDTVPMSGTEAAGDPLTLDCGTELSH